MSIVQTKSPCIIEITDPNLEGGLIDLYIYKQGSSLPTLFQYRLSKLIPASNVHSIYFDVSPYINEFITNKQYSPNVFVDDVNLPIENYCNVQIDKYKLIAGSYVYVAPFIVSAFKGYLEQKDALNPVTNDFLLDQKSYNYYLDPNASLSNPAGDITCYLLSTYVVKYTDLVTGATYSYSVTTNGFKKIYRVYINFMDNGNKVEIFTGAFALATYYFRPIQECRYTPVVLDFINKHGAWQREYLFKNSTDSINIESQSYKNYREIPNVLTTKENLINTFNTNGTESIKCNTGWVDQDFKDNIKQLLLSDRILINSRPAIVTTKQVEFQKNINNKLINYPLDFQFTNSII